GRGAHQAHSRRRPEPCKKGIALRFFSPIAARGDTGTFHFPSAIPVAIARYSIGGFLERDWLPLQPARKFLDAALDSSSLCRSQILGRQISCPSGRLLHRRFLLHVASSCLAILRGLILCLISRTRSRLRQSSLESDVPPLDPARNLAAALDASSLLRSQRLR